MREHLQIFITKTNRRVTISVLCGLGLLLSLVSFQIYEDYHLNISQIKNNAINWNHLLEQHAAATFDKVDHALLEVNSIIEARGQGHVWNKDSYHNLLESIALKNPEIKALKIIDQEGGYLGESDNKGPLAQAKNNDRKYFQTHKNDPKAGLIISEPVISKTSGIWVIVLSRRIFTTSNEFKGLILATIPLDYFENFYAKLKIGAHGSVTLMTDLNHILMVRHPRKTDHLAKPIVLSENVARAFEDKAESGLVNSVSSIDNVEKIFAYKKNARFGIIALTGLAKIDFLDAWLKKFIFIMIYGCIILIGFAILLHQYFRSKEKSDFQQMQLAESSKMSTLGEMAGGVAHEINNPLAIIGGRSQSIKRLLEMQPPDLEKAKNQLTNIETTVARIANIVQGLRMFSRQADNDSMQLVKLDQIVQQSLTLCSERFKNNNISLEVAEVPPVAMFCRETQISQVFLNLLSNAFDAAEALTEKWVKIEFKVIKDKIQISFTDSGKGIHPEIASKMLQPFFTTKPIGKGTGLGLSISNSIVLNHNGKIFLEEKSSHTKFVCEFDIAK